MRVQIAERVTSAALVASALAWGCGPEPPPATPRSSLLEAVAGRPTFQSPADWRYHPQREAPLRARFELERGLALLAGDRGERWLVGKRGVRAAARLAPENIVAILRSEDSGFLFVGASGTTYEAAEPLGPFTRSSAPLDRLSRVTAARGAVVGIGASGRLIRSRDAAAVWAPVGPEATRFVDVMLDPDGSGLALAVPEALWQTSDAGGTWKRVDTPTFGALGFVRDKREGLVVRSALGLKVWRAAASTFDSLGRSVVATQHKLTTDPPRGPDATALVSGRAALIGGVYVEVARQSKARDGWEMLKGPLDGKLEVDPLDLGTKCGALKVAGFGKFITLACAQSVAGDTHEVEFFRSEDGGETFKKEPFSAYASLSALRLAVGERGALVVTGVCGKKTRGCRPRGVHHRRETRELPKRRSDAKKKKSKKKEKTRRERIGDYELASSATPALKGTAGGLAFSTDGAIAYAVGRRTKNGAFAVFVSKNGGETFDAREIEQLQVSEDFGSRRRRSWERPARRAVRVVSAAPAEDGTLALVVEDGGEYKLVVTDDEGRAIAVSSAPFPGARLGAAGTRALAVKPQAGEVWESLDGGASWEPLGRVPVELCRPGDACTFDLACHVEGCVIGAEVSRIGWRGQADSDDGVLAPPDHRSTGVSDRKVRTLISCALEAESWEEIGVLSSLPRATDAALGRAVWFAGAADASNASVTTFHGIGGAKPRVERVKLLAPVAKPESYAFTYHDQIEGGIALRYPLPTATSNARLVRVEVAFDNRLEETVVRATIPDAGSFRSGDYTSAGARTRAAQPDLVSITPGGAHVRPHHYARDSQTTYFVDGKRVSTIPPVSWPSSSGSVAWTEMTRVGSTPVPIRALSGGAAVVRGRRTGSGWTFDAIATGLATPAIFGLKQKMQLAYLGTNAGVYVSLFDEVNVSARALFYPFRSEGAVLDTAIPAPTQLDAGDRPRRCSKHQRKATPRVVAAFLPGTRHPVVVTDPLEPMRVLITDGAVMHGTPKTPCVAAFGATPVPSEIAPPGLESAIIPMDDLEHSWLFRFADARAGRRVAEYRRMSCRFDPTLEVPPEALRVEGTLVRRR